LGFIGCGGRATSGLIPGLGGRDDCEIAMVCDPHRERLAQAAELTRSITGHLPRQTEDLRQVMSDPKIDAVVIATPDHWHTPAAVWACQAGKHVYVEKPMSHNLWEGRKLVEAARKYGVIVQVGTQNRSAPYNFAAREYLASGKLGNITLCRVYNQKSHGLIKLGRPGAPPDYLNWTLWNGRNVETDFYQSKYQSWHDFWCYSGGDVVNCGVHQLDLASMLLDINEHPRRVHTSGSKREGNEAETPDTVVTTFEFEDLIMTFHQTLDTPYMLKTDPEVRNHDLFPYWPQNATRIEIFGTEGIMFVGRHGGGWQVFGRPKQRQPVVLAQQYGRFPDPEHQQDWITAIREGRQPHADVEMGHRSAALCHFANISYRVGNQPLEIDTDQERFTNHEQANTLLRPPYREPFIISDPV
jgi:predicted dehydrogenase